MAWATAVTRFHDRSDGADYLYSLFVPADASTLFPCFDQPDLKARLALSLEVPVAWEAVANMPQRARHEQAGVAEVVFEPTPPISTYLFAFAAGPFAVLRDEASETHLFVRRSRVSRAQAESAEVFRLNREGLAYIADWFDTPFPFPKYDLVLIPEFAYGGMEHAGATFLREDSVLFPFVPSEADGPAVVFAAMGHDPAPCQAALVRRGLRPPLENSINDAQKPVFDAVNETH